MTKGRSIHMLSCARMFFDEEQAMALALNYGLDGIPVVTPTAFNFIMGRRADFRDVWMDRRKGYYFLRGRTQNGSSEMLHQRHGAVGIDAFEGKAAI